ncbi:MAG: chemotaxis protein CheA [Pseudomonadota bacterium]
MFQPASPLADPNAYRAIFFEETHEHLTQVEAILLRLQPDRTDQPYLDDLNAIFRAVHSIKGSAAMLGCDDMAALAHLQENLLDLLRKQERPLEPGDVEAMLRAGDTIQAQALRHRGVLDEPPDAAPSEELLRRQLARPRTDAKGAAPGPVVRRFAVQLAPLEEAIAQEDLDTMLEGLGEMGRLAEVEIANIAGGSVYFQVELEGTAADLHSVLSLVVPPELIAVEKLEPAASAPIAPPAIALDNGDELFIDPEEFKRKRAGAADTAAEPAAAGTPAEPPAADDFALLHEPIGLPAGETAYIRVATEKIDLLVNLVGELVITEAMLARSGKLEGTADGSGFSEGGLADLARHTRNLQEAVLAIRMLPISNVFSRFPRLVHELSQRLDKRVELRFFGEATELDRGLIEKISDPLTHLVRNGIDHGLEPPDEREAMGKPAAGTLTLRASQRGGNILIAVSDDGRGLDRERILARAAERRIPIAHDAPDAEVWQLVFQPGFSTARQVTDLSGRGVGMDVVRRNIQALGGSVDLVSTAGQGTTVTVSVPLTLAIMEAMTVAVAGQTYVLPLAAVVECVSVEPAHLHALPDQGDALRVRDDYLPVVHLARVFPPRGRAPELGAMAVIVEADGAYAALVVDELVGQQQVVVKSLEANFRKVPGLSGATVMGDGSVALILDVSHIVRTGGGMGSMRL